MQKTRVPSGLFQEHRSPSKNRAEYPFDHAKLFFSFLSLLLDGEFLLHDEKFTMPCFFQRLWGVSHI
jgi:hypothetical protein